MGKNKSAWPITYDNSDDFGGGQWYQVGPAQVWFRYHASDKEGTEALSSAFLIAQAPRLFYALEQAVENCHCSAKERLSGHKTDCFAPTWIDILETAKNGVVLK